MNTEWHRHHRLARDASHEQRVAWHAEHAAVCGCRPVPPSLAAEVARTTSGRPKAADATPGTGARGKAHHG
ncbi:MAG TPA: hypothetical protein VK277_05375 [Acidimicrobiales bacterium]|nr:hypothetical protein [Acidimicrobiales bacterium]